MIRKSSIQVVCVLALVLSLSWAITATGQDKPKTLDTDPNLAGWWKFDDTAGKTAVDSSKFKRKGTLKGELEFGKTSVEGKIGKALKFAGKEDVVEIFWRSETRGSKPE